VSIGVLKITFSFEKYFLYSERMSNLKEYFLLDPGVVFLNHGSFGATPKPVFEAYQAWQLRLECQPVLFLGREYDRLLRESREALGEYIQLSLMTWFTLRTPPRGSASLPGWLGLARRTQNIRKIVLNPADPFAKQIRVGLADLLALEQVAVCLGET
jgi:hypothetical protein